MEVMSTQNLIDQQDVGEFSSRLDSKVLNKTIALDFGFNQVNQAGIPKIVLEKFQIKFQLN